MKTVQLANFSVPSQEYISIVQDGNIEASVRLASENGKHYLDYPHIGKVDGGRLGTRQQERARALRDELLQQVTDAVKAAGWDVSDSLGFTSYRRNGNKQDSVTPMSIMQAEGPKSNVTSQDSVTPASVVPVKVASVALSQTPTPAANKKQITVGTYTRTVSIKLVTFQCARCGQTVTQERYPSPKPMYCSDACRKEVEREQTRIRVQNLRAKKKA